MCHGKYDKNAIYQLQHKYYNCSSIYMTLYLIICMYIQFTFTIVYYIHCVLLYIHTCTCKNIRIYNIIYTCTLCVYLYLYTYMYIHVHVHCIPCTPYVHCIYIHVHVHNAVHKITAGHQSISDQITKITLKTTNGQPQ